jgi:hypothetical protein
MLSVDLSSISKLEIMRDALKQISNGEYWVCGPSTQEFDHVVDLVQRYSDYADQCTNQIIRGVEVPKEFEDAHAEASSDLRHYNHIEKGLLWSFALWRIQSMFEALLISHYLPAKPTKPLIGLHSKLSAITAAGYQIETTHLEELKSWGSLRNTLSHMPPEHFRPISIDREDVEDFVSLLKDVCLSWSKQRPQICN